MKDNEKSNKSHKINDAHVIFHCGYKGREIPRKLIFKGDEYLIENVISSQRVQISGTGKIIEKFLCLIEGKEVWISIGDSGKVDVKFT